MDFITQIKCPDCPNQIVHRYQCTCDDVWGYCRKQDHTFFFCPHCAEEKKVSWEDEIRPKPELIRAKGVVTREMEEREKAALAKMFKEWENPEDPDPMPQLAPTTPLPTT